MFTFCPRTRCAADSRAYICADAIFPPCNVFYSRDQQFSSELQEQLLGLFIINCAIHKTASPSLPNLLSRSIQLRKYLIRAFRRRLTLCSRGYSRSWDVLSKFFQFEVNIWFHRRWKVYSLKLLRQMSLLASLKLRINNFCWRHYCNDSRSSRLKAIIYSRSFETDSWHFKV